MSQARREQADELETAASLAAIVENLPHAADGASALVTFARALELAEKRLGIGSDPLMQTIAAFAEVELPAALEPQRTALFLDIIDRREKICGAASSCVTTTLESYAVYLSEQARFTEAEEILLDILGRVVERTDAMSVEAGWCYESLGDHYARTGRYDEGADAYAAAVMRYRRYEAVTFDRLAYALNSFAELRKLQGRFEESIVLYEDALKICERYEPPASQNALVLLKNISFVHDRLGDFPAVQALIERVLGTYRQHGLEPDEFLIDTLREYAVMCCNAGNCDLEAEALIQALSRGEMLWGRHSRTVMRDRQTLGNVYASLKRFDEAHDVLMAALFDMDAESEAYDQDAISLLNDLAGVCRNAGKHDEAVAYLIRAVELALECPAIAANEVILLQSNLARGLWALERFDDVEDTLMKSLAYAESAYGRTHEQVGEALRELTSFYHVRGRFADAVPYQEHLCELSAALGSSDPDDLASEMTRLARLYHAVGRYAEAEQKLRSAIALDLASPLERTEELAYRRALLADVLADAGDVVEAETQYLQAISAYQESGLRASQKHADVLNCYARLLANQNELSRAEEYFWKSLEISRGFVQPSTAQYIAASSLARIKIVTDRLDTAGLLYDEAIEAAEAAYGIEHPYTAIALVNRAGIIPVDGPIDRAEALLRRALYIDERAYGHDHVEVAVDLRNLAQIVRRADRYPEAESLLRRAIAICETYGESAVHEYGRCLKEISEVLAAMHRATESDVYAKQMFALSQSAFEQASLNDEPLRIDFLN